MKGFALGLALEQRRKATRKSPIHCLTRRQKTFADKYICTFVVLKIKCSIQSLVESTNGSVKNGITEVLRHYFDIKKHPRKH